MKLTFWDGEGVHRRGGHVSKFEGQTSVSRCGEQDFDWPLGPGTLHVVTRINYETNIKFTVVELPHGVKAA